ncbi:protein seele [Leptopilina heterotoma]|uniref:protein seele n=1 Tax=Leptopilina heterotoma TaxID=63436 RepID=UPI001CA89FDA|nr:protein seele [Leptopilina heterotoma]XP_043485329.1 protein seele [Leptopilina heterotoma]
MYFIIVSVFLFTAYCSIAQEVDPKELRCLVCRKTVDELQSKFNNIDSSKTVEVGQYRLDADGNTLHKKVPLAKSEIYISETLDEVCAAFDNYAKATYKNSGNLVLIDLQNPFNDKSPKMDQVNFIQDGDLNKSLKFLCEDIVNDYEETFIKVFREDTSNAHNDICTNAARYCEEDLFYGLEDASDSIIDTDKLDDIDRTEL